MLRPSTLIASGCLALLSVWRAADGSYLLAMLFAVLALANLGVGLWAARARRGLGSPAIPRPATAEQASAEAAKQRRVRAGWLRIMLFGWAAAIIGAFAFPPMSLVLAALALYASFRFGRCSQLVRALDEAAGTDADRDR